MRPVVPLSVILLGALLALSACKSSEEKAEGYYQSGMTLLAQGDEDRALLEFRNVFKYDGFHEKARHTYADVLLKRGEVREAYSQYLRLIEQYPNLADVRQTLAETAFSLGNWDEVERHGKAAIELAPDEPRSQVIAIVLDYRSAALARDPAAQAEVAKRARALLETQPDNLTLRRVVIDQEMTGPDPAAAMPMIEAALEIAPDDGQLHAMKLKLLGQTGDMQGLGAELKIMVGLYPDSAEIKQSLIRWFMAQKDTDGAEAFLRTQAGDPKGPTEGHVTLVQFIDSVRGRAAARAEIKQLIEANARTPNADIYASMLATMDFEEGRKVEAMAALEAIVAKAEPSDQSRKITALLARMRDSVGDREQARTLVEQILAVDATNVDALLMRAAWSIAADTPAAAIIDLRAAQSQAPRDPRIMTLLAAAFQRDGSLDLAGEQLAKAVEASNSAPDESLRYAAFLRDQDRLGVAESVLMDARRVSPAHPGVLRALAEVLVRERKWPQVEEIAATLKTFGTEEAMLAAQQLQAAVLFDQNRVDEGLALLENMTSGDGAASQHATVVVIMTQIRAGKIDKARAFLDDALKKDPAAPALRLLLANIDVIQGRTAEAEAGYRALIADTPKSDLPVRLLYGLLKATDRADAAKDVLAAGLAEMPDNVALLTLEASQREGGGDIEGAIDIYQRLYALDSSNVIFANNLASLISSNHDDAESLDRAEAIARRLRGTREPAFQDTYGWIAYRRGNLEEALTYLEPAGKGLPKDPVAQMHLGLLYADLGRNEDAIDRLKAALALGKALPPAQIETIGKRLTELTGGGSVTKP